MSNFGRKLQIFIVVAFIALFGIIYAFTKTPVQAPVTTSQNQTTNDTSPSPDNQSNLNPVSPTPPQVQVSSNVITYQGQNGKTALAILKANHRVEAKHYDFGDLVTGIDGITPDSSHFWAMYVNNQFSQVGASAYITKNSDTIRWQIDKIQ